jgi:hypothetical protein
MDEYQYNPELEELPEDSELSHADKAVGVITEPGPTFSEMSRFPPKTIDWLLPFFLFMVMVVLSQVLQNSNPEIAYNTKQKQIEAAEKRFEESVKEGTMSRAEADKALEMIEGMNFFVLTIVGTIFTLVLFFFLISAIFLLFGRFVFKGGGTYSSALVAYGLSMYIGIIEVIVYTIAALLLKQGMANASIGSFMDVPISSPYGLLLWILNPISIWMYIVIGIGLGKMFKRNVTPFIILTLILFILSMFLAYSFS